MIASAEVWAFAGVIGGALVTGALSLAGVVITSRTRKENAEQHAASVSALRTVAEKVDQVDGKLDEHIVWHLGRRRDTA